MKWLGDIFDTLGKQVANMSGVPVVEYVGVTNDPQHHQFSSSRSRSHSEMPAEHVQQFSDIVNTRTDIARITLSASWFPNGWLSVDMRRTPDDQIAKRPHYKYGELWRVPDVTFGDGYVVQLLDGTHISVTDTRMPDAYVQRFIAANPIADATLGRFGENAKRVESGVKTTVTSSRDRNTYAAEGNARRTRKQQIEAQKARGKQGVESNYRLSRYIPW